jgi:hypothetical protein
MRCVIGFARSISPLGWIRQRYREHLSLSAQDRPFSNRFGRTAAFRPGEILTSARATCNPIAARRLTPHPLGFYHPFNAHRPGIFRRFSPIRF